MIKIIDDFLNDSYANYLEETILSPNQEWFFQNNLTINDEDFDVLDFGFNFWIWRSNEGLVNNWESYLILPLLLKIKDEVNCKNIIRSRLDLTVCSHIKKQHKPHVDLKIPNITTIYYVSDSDGDTLIFNEKEESEVFTVKESIRPKKNRLLIFDGSYYHTGYSPQKFSSRILINSNFS